VSYLRTFVENFSSKLDKNNNFLQFIITNNKPVLTEIILAEILNCDLEKKSKNIIKLSAFDHIKTFSENKIFFNLNKSKSNSRFLIYDILINTNKHINNLYEFENKSENIIEKLSEKKLSNFVCLQIDQENKEKILKENKFVKIQNSSFVKELIKKFSFDWLFKDNFFKKINFYSNSNNFYNSIQYLKNFDEGFKLLLSNYFVEFNSSRSDFTTIDNNKGLNFYGNSESFLNFFDESVEGNHIVKINIGEIKFEEAIHKLDSLCLEKKIIVEENFKNQGFSIQSGSIQL
tara:strand:+ start:2097 stop:2963 length:867 start_codon:yes stop_codon:yes gene_type:complete